MCQSTPPPPPPPSPLVFILSRLKKGQRDCFWRLAVFEAWAAALVLFACSSMPAALCGSLSQGNRSQGKSFVPPIMLKTVEETTSIFALTFYALGSRCYPERMVMSATVETSTPESRLSQANCLFCCEEFCGHRAQRIYLTEQTLDLRRPDRNVVSKAIIEREWEFKGLVAVIAKSPNSF